MSRCSMAMAARTFVGFALQTKQSGGIMRAWASRSQGRSVMQFARVTGWTGRLVPLTVDGLIYASSMVMLDSARRKVPVPALAR